MTTENFTHDQHGAVPGPFEDHEVRELVQSGVLEPNQVVTTTSGKKIQAADVLQSGSNSGPSPPPPPLPATKQAWDPRTIAWLSLIFSPLWSGAMAVLNAKRLHAEQPRWRPISIGVAVTGTDILLRLTDHNSLLFSSVLYLGAAWLIWHLDLRPQVNLYSQQADQRSRTASWLVPLIVGSPLALAVFCCFIVAPLIPETPEYISVNDEGMRLSQGGEYELGLARFQEAVTINPQFATGHNNVGWANANLGRPSEALRAYDKAIALSPDLTVAFLNRGLLLNNLGEFERAIADFNVVLATTDNSPDARVGRGQAHLAIGRLDEAIADFTYVIEQDPNFVLAYQGRAEVYIEQEDYEKAIQDCTRAISIDPQDGSSFFLRAIAYRLLGQSDAAIEDFSHAIRNDPSDPEYYYGRGVVYLDKQEYRKAIADFDSALRLNPNFSLAKENKAIAEKALQTEIDEQVAPAATIIHNPQDHASSSPSWSFSPPKWQPENNSVPPGAYIAGGRGIRHLLIHGGLGKKLLVGFAGIWVALFALRKRLFGASG